MFIEFRTAKNTWSAKMTFLHHLNTNSFVKNWHAIPQLD